MAYWVNSTLGDDLAFLKQHLRILTLEDANSPAKVVIAPELQARALTSAATGDCGNAFGWINRELIASGERRRQINAFGGEDRFWPGPEGGQFSLFFKKSAAFEFENWQTPEAVDWGEWTQTAAAPDRASFHQEFKVENYAGAVFHVLAERSVNMLCRTAAADALRVRFGKSIKLAAYESVNRITNNGEAAWTKESGLLSIWILGMLNPSPGTIIVAPFKSAVADNQPPINTGYFGDIPSARFSIAGQSGR